MSSDTAGDADLIELRSWQQFLKIADLLHFGRAAQALGMTQPPLTQAIQKLEQRLGTPLFERTRRSVRLLPAGVALVEPVRDLIRAARGLPAISRAAAGGKVGMLRLGFISTVGFGALPEWLRSFRQEHSGVTVQLKEATSDVQRRALADGKLDAGFVLHASGSPLPDDSGLNRLSIGIEPLMLALPDATTPSVKSLTAAQLLAQPLIIFPRESAPSLYDGILAFYHRQGATPTIAQEAIQMQTIVNLVSAGLGIALVPKAISALRRTGVIYRKIPAKLAKAAPRCETSLVWPELAGPIVEGFVEHVRQQVKSRDTGRNRSNVVESRSVARPG
jgi:DNA-binding transcriptional LysR family regulator